MSIYTTAINHAHIQERAGDFEILLTAHIDI